VINDYAGSEPVVRGVRVGVGIIESLDVDGLVWNVGLLLPDGLAPPLLDFDVFVGDWLERAFQLLLVEQVPIDLREEGVGLDVVDGLGPQALGGVVL
jgi:hypothetical protein